jgi:hypothetical protein
LNGSAPGNKFEFTIEFENLAPVELGALLWSLEMDGRGYHRLGFAKPLGLGSVQMQVKMVQLLEPEQRYRSLTQTGLQECSRGQWQPWVDEFKRALAALYGARDFEGLDNVRDLRALLGEPTVGLPVHYPRDPDGRGQGENFRWFMQNRRSGHHALPVPTEELNGLPYRP